MNPIIIKGVWWAGKSIFWIKNIAKKITNLSKFIIIDKEREMCERLQEKLKIRKEQIVWNKGSRFIKDSDFKEIQSLIGKYWKNLIVFIDEIESLIHKFWEKDIKKIVNLINENNGFLIMESTDVKERNISSLIPIVNKLFTVNRISPWEYVIYKEFIVIE